MVERPGLALPARISLLTAEDPPLASPLGRAEIIAKTVTCHLKKHEMHI